MDGGWLSARRIGVTDLLARPDAADVEVMGCGVQGPGSGAGALGAADGHVHDVVPLSATAWRGEDPRHPPGAGEPVKLEVAPAALQHASVVTDDLALASPVLPRIDTALEDGLHDSHAARAGRDQTTVISPVDMPLQDCVVARHA